MIHPHEDLTRITLKVLFIGGLLVASFWVIQPFLPAIIWAMTLVIATWPLMIWVQRHAGNSRGIAVLVMTLALLLVLIVPLGLAISTIVANIDQIGDLARTILSLRMPPPPDWLAGVPLLGAARRRSLGKADLGRSAGTGPQTYALRRSADPMVRIRCRKSGWHVHPLPADDRDCRGHVCRRRASRRRPRSCSAAGWVAIVARWPCASPARRSAAWPWAWS